MKTELANSRLVEKLIVITDDGVSGEFLLTEKHISVGRDEKSVLCLKDKSVSRHHATLQRVFRGFSLQDEGSTNGTRVNGQAITKRFLTHGDLIEIGKYHLRYFAAEESPAADDPDRTVVLRPVHQSELKPEPETPKSEAPKPHAVTEPPVTPPETNQESEPVAEQESGETEGAKVKVRYLSGKQQGEEKVVDRAYFSVGNPGGDLVLINKRHSGYFLVKLGGDEPPKLNGKPIKAGGVELNNGDRIELGELSLEFINQD
jgi:pSer/pThr/pTyr-binding forkhead associated (FHA) protein